MTYFDQIGAAIYDGVRQLPVTAIKRGVKEMGLVFPLMIMAAKPPRRKKVITNGLRHQKYFWHLHEGLVYIFWHEQESTNASYSMRDWFCGEPQHCTKADYFVHSLQNAILSFRRQEMKVIIRHKPLAVSFAEELDTRRLALCRIQESLAGKSTFGDAAWQNALEVWLEIILMRHQEHLNTLHRKMDEFISLLSCDQDTDRVLGNNFNRLQRELRQIYSLGEMRSKFPELIAELIREFPLVPSADQNDLSLISQQALKWFEKHFHEPVSVADCAKSIPVSAAYLCRLLRRETGLSPVRHLQHRRIAHAKVLLQESRFTITEIARRSGFGATEHFYRVFHQHTNLTPAAYRRNAKRR